MNESSDLQETNSQGAPAAESDADSDAVASEIAGGKNGFSSNSEIAKLLEKVVSQIGGSARTGQIEMAQRVSSAIENMGHLMVQAGTGTGKSFGYLVPAMLYAAKTGGRVIISTATIALQRQIIMQDAPLVAAQVKKKQAESRKRHC
ncbi:hypothetical protein RQN30_02710 [Arcanobacterium hippocoleae]